jgi:hypothetical protein
MEANSPTAVQGKYVRFAAVWFMLVGVLSVLAGIAAISDREYFEGAQSISGSLETWGVIWLIEGVVSVIVGWLILKGSGGAKFFGVFLACAGLIVWFFCVGIMPIWAIVHMVAYAFVIWGLVVHGD